MFVMAKSGRKRMNSSCILCEREYDDKEVKYGGNGLCHYCYQLRWYDETGRARRYHQKEISLKKSITSSQLNDIALLLARYKNGLSTHLHDLKTCSLYHDVYDGLVFGNPNNQVKKMLKKLKEIYEGHRQDGLCDKDTTNN